jgi:nucleoside-diphosphate-sugar epimerase
MPNSNVLKNKVLVTGGTGYLGSYLILELLNRGYEVCITVREKSTLEKVSKVQKQIKLINIDEDEWEDKIVNWSPSYVIHSATNYGRNGESNHEVVNTNVTFPLKVLGASIRMLRPPVFINIDTSLPKNINNYSRSKNDFLELLKKSSASLKIINIVLENFYGPKDEQFISSILKRILSKEKEIDFTIGVQKRDFIHIEDVVPALCKVLEKVDGLESSFTEFDLGSGVSVSIKDVVELMVELTGLKDSKLNWGAIELRENEVMNSSCNLTKIRTIGWEPRITLRDGIKKLINEEK